MKAIRLVEVGAPLELQDVPVPDPSRDEVLIREAVMNMLHEVDPAI